MRQSTERVTIILCLAIEDGSETDVVDWFTVSISAL